MGVGVMIISHDEIGLAILATATRVYGESPLKAQALAVSTDEDPDHLCRQGVALAAQLDSGDGVLILSDLYGSTPGNIALRVAGEMPNARCLSGLNLPMLLRIFNYPLLPLEDLTDKAIAGGRDGIVA